MGLSTVPVQAGVGSLTAKIPSGSGGGTYTFNNTFGAGQWVLTQNLAATTTLSSQSLSTANTVTNITVSSSTSSASINIQPISTWENLDGGVNTSGNTTATYSSFSVANGFMYSSANTMSRSSDGTTWTLAGVTGNEMPVLFYNNLYVTGAYTSSNGKIYSSTDGLTWTERVAQFANQPGYPPYAGAVAPNATNKFLVGGNGGFLYRSADGISWTNLSNTAMGSNTVNGIASNGNSLYVVVGDSGRIITSTDGASFTTRTTGTANNFKSVAFGGGLFVAGGQSGTLRTSSDGTTWTTVSGLSGDIVSVFYASGQTYPWVILLQSGNVYYSADGSTWLGSVATGAGNNNLRTGIYFNGKYRIGGGTNATTGLGQYKATTNVLGTLSQDYYATFIGPSTQTTVTS